MTADPDPVWQMGPLPDPGPALTADEAAEWAEYDDYVDRMQGTVLDGRVETETDWRGRLPGRKRGCSGGARRPNRRRRLASGRPRTRKRRPSREPGAESTPRPRALQNHGQ